MEQFYTSSLFLGLFRLSLLLLFVMIWYRLASSGADKPNSNYGSFIFYICAHVLLCFVLVQINSFDRLTVLFFIFGFIAFKALDLRWGVPISKQLKEKRENTLLFFLKFTDTSASFSDYLRPAIQKSNLRSGAKKLLHKNILIKYGLPIAVFITSYLSRVWFLNFDSYTFSDIWYNDLTIVKSLSRQIWFENPDIMLGEYALISLYAQLTQISSSMALQTFGFLESALLAVSIFWGTSKFTKTSWFPGMIAALGFIFLYGYMLLDIATITQHKSVLLALAITIPVFVMILQPETLSKFKREYFLKMLVLFSGIAFIDLFVMLVVLPLFFLFSIFCIPKVQRTFFKGTLLAFGISLVLIVLIHGVAAYYTGGSFSEFIYSKLYSVSSYTFVPQLVLPYTGFVVFLQLIAISGLLLILPLWILNKKKWYGLLSFSLLFLSLTLMMNANNIFFDRDLLNQVISVFTPMSLAVLVYVIYSYGGIVLGQKRRIPVPVPFLIVVLVLGFLGFWQQKKPLQLAKRSLAIENVLTAYSTIKDSYLPYSYAIVNSGSCAPISRDSHYFINYNFFNTQYLDLDANYSRHKANKAFLKENPDLILPNTTFVFLYSKDAILNTKNGINEEEQRQVRENLSVLRQRDRQIKLFYKGKQVEVYKIINEPDGGNINDLLLKINAREIF